MRFAGFHALLLVASLFLSVILPSFAQNAAAPPSGIACALMLVALLVTYLVH
ncbi:unnamed protein product [Spirodela intermedia]|uniref:Uncharacterized protein n=1 Tax=Spirodela intermedia TaxID=51605 RepID=A0A7I8LIS7_SPIIN|nr:unnamed protein product [Spirodela intermedia]